MNEELVKITMIEPCVVPLSGYPMPVGGEYEVTKEMAVARIKRGHARYTIDVHMEKMASFGVKEITVEEGADKLIFVAAKKYGITCHTKLSKEQTKH